MSTIELATAVIIGTAVVFAPIDSQLIRDLNTEPAILEPEPIIEPAIVANYDCYGTLWGYDTMTKTEEDFQRTLSEGGTFEEWNVTDRNGQPIRIVRTTAVDTSFLGGIDISVIPVTHSDNARALAA